MDIGSYIRQQVIPTGMTVTEAAEKLGVGRPALSQILNGGAALSPEMVLRLETTFGADRKQLLDLQAASDRDRRRDEDRAVPVSSYVPDFLTIKAKQIEDWADTIDARNLLPVMLRRLIHSTGRELHHVDFPGFDNAQRRGWDGWVEADAATSWVPAGRSGWEFSVEQPPQGKAECDYQARLRMLTPAERADCTFVFVTPRNWPGKVTWAKIKDAADDWKAVRAFDASDLEQWLETAVAPQIWLARELRLPTTGFLTIDAWWDQWSADSEPPMTDAIFAPSIERHGGAFCKWLAASPERPFTVAADSREEAVAFITCLLRQNGLPAGSCDRAVLFDQADTLRLLAPSSAPFIPIVRSEETERAIGDMCRNRHCIVVRPRNAVGQRPDIEVDLLDPKAFANALTDMGIEQNRIHRLARESGLSPTVLRRRLSKVPAIRKPPWAQDTAVVRHLLPMTLVGTWHAGSTADCEILAAIAKTSSYSVIEDTLADLLGYDDCPVWQVGQHCGVVSKIDALFAVAPLMTQNHITEFVDFAAEYVLSESDPSLELRRDQRWNAGLYGKVREHSPELRTGLCETLVLLAVHGDSLFPRLGLDVEGKVSALIRRLLTPLTDKLLSNKYDLPNYAEAAPEAFLTLLEEDLRQPAPALRTLMEPAGPAPFDAPSRTGLLWALERLAWSPKYLMRVVLVLADLSHTEIDDRWSNTPVHSLVSIFRSWIPQTSAPLAERIKALETLCKRFPDVGWQICIRQLEFGHLVAHPSERPRWRNDAAGAGEHVAEEEHDDFVRKAADLAIRWEPHSESTLGDLVEHIGGVPDQDQSEIWTRIDDWSRTETDEWKKAALRERIRDAILARRGGLGRELRRMGTVRERAYAAYEILTPRDPIARHAWLFSGFWVQLPVDEGPDGNIDWKGEQVHVLRSEAMAEIWSAGGLDGAITLLPESEARIVGRYAAPCAVDKRSAANVLRRCLANTDVQDQKIDDFMLGFIESVEDDVRSHILSAAAEISNVNEMVRLFRCAPFGDQTWRLLDKQVEEVRHQYWKSVAPTVFERTEHETNEFIDRLLQADRPKAAFFAVHLDWEKVTTSRLRRLLVAVASVDSKHDDHFRIDLYQLSEAFKSLDGRPGITPDEMAHLEFMFIEALQDSEHGIPHLEQRIAESPSLFVQVLALVYRRSDDGHDPSAWRVDDPGRRTALGIAANQLLERVKRIPGTDSDGQVDTDTLMRWVTEARALCKDHGRTVIGDVKIGEWLSRASSEDDTRWPCRPICEVLEKIASKDMATGFRIGVHNDRGFTTRGVYDGGSQERDLAAGYDAWAQAWRYEYPFVAKTLDEIARGYELDAEREDASVQVRKRQEL